MFEATLRYDNYNPKTTIETSLTELDSALVMGRLLAASGNKTPYHLIQFIEDSDESFGYYVEPSLIEFRTGSDFHTDGELRQWHQAYADELGGEFKQYIENKTHIRVPELTDDQVESIVAADIEFQEEFVASRARQKLSKYESKEFSKYRPDAVIPWFHKTRNTSDIHDNQRVLNAATQVADLPVKPCLFTTQGFIADADNRENLVNLVEGSQFDECFLWIEDLDKHDVGKETYKNTAQLVSSLDTVGTPPHFYYGDHFSTLLSHLGATGTTYGTLYGEEDEERRESSDGGGLFSRYYVSELKDFLSIPATVNIKDTAGDEMCSCDVCSRQFDEWRDLAERANSDDVPDEATNLNELLKKHHVRTRWQQIRQVSEESLDESLDRLLADYETHLPHYDATQQVASRKDLSYLEQWANAITEVLAEESAATAEE